MPSLPDPNSPTKTCFVCNLILLFYNNLLLFYRAKNGAVFSVSSLYAKFTDKDTFAYATTRIFESKKKSFYIQLLTLVYLSLHRFLNFLITKFSALIFYFYICIRFFTFQSAKVTRVNFHYRLQLDVWPQRTAIDWNVIGSLISPEIESKRHN